MRLFLAAFIFAGCILGSSPQNAAADMDVWPGVGAMPKNGKRLIVFRPTNAGIAGGKIVIALQRRSRGFTLSDSSDFYPSVSYSAAGGTIYIGAGHELATFDGKMTGSQDPGLKIRYELELVSVPASGLKYCWALDRKNPNFHVHPSMDSTGLKWITADDGSVSVRTTYSICKA